MGTLVGLTLINRVSSELKDPNNRRWSMQQMLDWLNDGQREICMLKPDAYVKSGNISLVAGTRQDLPADGLLLLDIVRYMGAGSVPSGRITVVERETLDQLKANWGSSTGGIPDCYVYDRRFPKVFYIYPGATSGTAVHAHYAAVPVDVQVENIYGAPEGANSAICIDDIYATALVDYLQMRAHAKDTDAQDLVRSGQDYQRFLNRLGLKLQVDRSMDPNGNSPPREKKREQSNGNVAY